MHQSSSSSQNPAESSAHNASVPDELWAQRDQPALEDIKLVSRLPPPEEEGHSVFPPCIDVV